VPVVLAVTNFRGWRFWFFLAVGSCIDPVAICGFLLYAQLSEPHSEGAWAGGEFFFIYAGAVSFISTLIYLLLIRALQFPQIPNSDNVGGQR
jgi:hypothetical protein